MSNPLIEAKALVTGWQQPVIGPISFAVAPGEILGLTGPNGIGKTTLMSCLSGEAMLFSGEIHRHPGIRINLQTQQLPPLDRLPLSGRELLALTQADHAGLPAWLQDKLDQRLDRLSGGQRQYLALWAVLQAPGDLILLDEPTNNLDQAGTHHLVQALHQRISDGSSIMLVSHDHEFMSEACTRMLRLGERPS